MTTARRERGGSRSAAEAHEGAPGQGRAELREAERLVEGLLPGLLVAGAAALAQLALSRGARSTPASRAAAGLLAAGGLVLMGSSAATLVRARTTVSPHDLSGATALVRSGPFGRSRNPIYLGIAGLLLAHAVGRRSWPALLPAALFAAVMDRSQIPAEEEALRDLFGAEYEDHLREVVGPPAEPGAPAPAPAPAASHGWRSPRPPPPPAPATRPPCFRGELRTLSARHRASLRVARAAAGWRRRVR